jgi:signal transduction histidine kinase/ActR/RegA family two-component response regulator
LKSLPDDTRLHRGLEWLRIVAVAAIAVPAVVFAGVAVYMYRDEFTSTRERLAGTARIAEEQALKLFETNEMLLHRMLDLVGNKSDADILANGEEMHQRLKEMAAALPQVQGLFINGADSRALVYSRVYPPPRQIDFSDREYYLWHRSAERGVFVTEQLISRATGEPFFDMSRRRTLAKGAFGGTVNVSLRPEYLTHFYERLERSGAGTQFAVFRDDGRVIARWPGKVKPGARLPAESYLMKSISEGGTDASPEGSSPFDKVDRLASWRRIGDYPVYIVAAIDRSHVMAAWHRRVGLLALFTFPLALGFAWMAWFAMHRAREEIQSGRRLREETERRERIELSLIKSQKLEAMGRLAGGVAHDFNNLLMVVSNNAHLLRRLIPGGENSQLAAIDRAVASGAKLTRQMLSFARQQALHPQRILMKDRIPAILDLLRPVLGHSIQVSATVADDAAAIEVDSAELELALINLAVNAKDAMPEGGRIEVLVKNTRVEGFDEDMVLIEVVDTGFGIEAATLERVFEPFFTTKPVGYGTGLGLSQVQGLCQSAGGMARVASEPGIGTRVQLYFPARGTQADSADTVQTGTGHFSCRLLLVDDNQSLAQGTSEVLRSMGCRVQTAGDAKSALAWVAAAEFDLVLTDIEMPGGMDGIALAAKLADERPDLPVLLMTGYATRLEEATRQRFTVLPKPCTPTTLATAIRNALAQRPRRTRVSSAA